MIMTPLWDPGAALTEHGSRRQRSRRGYRVDENAALVRRETGMEVRMKESYVEGLATHDDPESCVSTRKGAGEALTGAHVCEVLSREINLIGVPTL